MEFSPHFGEALAYATQLHSKQIRKGTEIPYISHLLAVSSIALENGADEETAIAAILHDAVEDQGGKSTAEAIRLRFGNKVADIVQACSDTDAIPKPPWRKRKEDYLAHLQTASREALLVSASDKLHNSRAILADQRQLGSRIWDRFTGGREGSLWYYRSLVTIFRERFAKLDPEHLSLIDELERVVSEIERLAE